MVNERTPVVLVADDEPSMLALVAQHARTMGYQVVEASDGEQAWTLAKEHLPDLVLLDVMMPGMNGWEVCRNIREHVALAHTGVVMLTGIGEKLNEMTSPLYGADAYIDKPFQFAELDDKVRGTLARRAAERQGIPGLARTEPADGPGRHPARSGAKKKAAGGPKKKAAGGAKQAAKKTPAKARAKLKTPAKKSAAKAKPAKKVAKTTPAKRASKKAAPKRARSGAATKRRPRGSTR